VTVVASDRVGVGPGRSRPSPSVVMTRYRAHSGRRIEARLATDEGLVERDVDRSIAMRPSNYARRRGGLRHRVAGRARIAAQTVRRRFHVSRVRSRGLRVSGEEAQVARRVRLGPIAVTRTACQNSAWLRVTARAGRRARGGKRHVRGPRQGPVVTPAAGIVVLRIEHLGPSLASKKCPVERRAPRVDDARGVHGALERGAAAKNPSRHDGRLRGAQESAMGRGFQDCEDGRKRARWKRRGSTGW